MLDLWLEVLQREGASVPGGDFQELFCYARTHVFFRSLQSAFLTAEWKSLGDYLLQFFTADCSMEFLRLIITWKRLEGVLCNSQPPSSEVSEDSSSLMLSSGEMVESFLLVLALRKQRWNAET